MKNFKQKQEQGFSLIEIVVGLAILLALFLGMAQHFETSTRASRESMHETQAGYLAEEGIEVVKFMRAESWSDNIASLETGEDYGLTFSGGSWQTTEAPQAVGVFQRSFVLEDVYRDGDDDIIENSTGSGTLDPGTKKLTVLVTWQGAPENAREELTTYITDLYND